ncbi:DUF3617 family protein [Parasphingopyxis sp.]|uniref:DUF3617 domain-containing protein n=1 Tax=Parasphingopyxis sp. TaxID=1920299 RepID=UPI0026060820|nr:DUF3617 family protein [Parasphingopyxis sp.]
MRNLAIAALPVLALAACSGGSESLQPGQWDMTFAVTDVSGEGVTEAMRDEIAGELDRELAMESTCISEAQAAAPDESLVLNSEVISECNIGESVFENGTIDIAGTCGDGGDGGEIAVTGTYSATGIDAEMTATIRDGGQEFSFAGNITGERTGDCPG